MKEELDVKKPKKKMKTSDKILIVIAVIFACVHVTVIGLAICGVFMDMGNTYTEFKVDKKGNIKVNKNVRISNVIGNYYKEEKAYYIEGYLENKSDKKISSIDIEYLVYDKNNVLLGTGNTFVSNLKGNQKWRFKAIYEDIDANLVDYYELSSVSIY